MGYCGLDRHRQPLEGDEVRACWEDGAIPLEPEPSIPGLLDLLTERALPVMTSEEGVEAEGARPARPVRRLRSTTVSRDWVEVEV